MPTQPPLSSRSSARSGPTRSAGGPSLSGARSIASVGQPGGAATSRSAAPGSPSSRKPYAPRPFTTVPSGSRRERLRVVRSLASGRTTRKARSNARPHFGSPQLRTAEGHRARFSPWPHAGPGQEVRSLGRVHVHGELHHQRLAVGRAEVGPAPPARGGSHLGSYGQRTQLHIW